MGCGGSAIEAMKSEFDAVAFMSVGDALEKTDGERVHVCGRVAHCGIVMVTPFGALEGVAARIVADTKGAGAGAGRKKTFTALNVIDFKLVDVGQELLVKGGAWQLALATGKNGHYEMNILRDDKRVDDSEPTGQVKSGGTAWNQRNMPPLTVKPHASDWWAKYNNGYDELPGSAATTATTAYGSYSGQAPRGAREFVLKVGELCAVVGTIRKTDAGVQLVCANATGGSMGAITNKGAVAESLKVCKAEAASAEVQCLEPRGGEAQKAEVVPMHLA